MSASYGGLQSLVCSPVSRVTQKSNISLLNTGGCGRDCRGRGREYIGRGYGCVHGCGRGG